MRRGIVPDLLTDQTSAHDPLNGYIPGGLLGRRSGETAHVRSERSTSTARWTRSPRTCAPCWNCKRRGAITFDYGNNIRRMAADRGVTDAFHIPGFVPEYIRPLFAEGRGPFRWVALSGDPADIAATDELVCRLFSENASLTRWISLARERVHFQGLPARICWLGYGERARFALEMNRMVADGRLKAPIVIGRDHLDCGSVASPYRETEAMPDGSDAIADWPILNALLNTAAGASWVSVHNGGGVGIGYSLHAGQVTVADGTPSGARCLERVLTCDPGIGVLRHVDAGYEPARTIRARRRTACSRCEKRPTNERCFVDPACGPTADTAWPGRPPAWRRSWRSGTDSRRCRARARWLHRSRRARGGG